LPAGFARVFLLLIDFCTGVATPCSYDPLKISAQYDIKAQLRFVSLNKGIAPLLVWQTFVSAEVERTNVRHSSEADVFL
jgi:hypothetical protein